MTSPFIGKVIDNYRILENLGIGGMGVVFKAIHISLDKIFALKMIAPGLLMNENFIRRFQKEAKALAKLEDPNIVRIYDLRCHNEQWFIVMEFVDGSNLMDKIKSEGPLPWPEAVSITKQILNAVGHAHQAGIVHRDLKPNNVMITHEGTVKITDFGLAKDKDTLSHTQTVASGGTLYYMSPEHIRGVSFTDKRSDIYSIGMTLYEMLTGRVPFEDINSDFELRETIVRKDLNKPTVYKPDVPAKLEKIVMNALKKDIKSRYQSTEEMLTDLKKFEESEYQVSDQPDTKTSRFQQSNSMISAFLSRNIIIPIQRVKEYFADYKMLQKRVAIPLAMFLIIIALLILFIPEEKSPEFAGSSPESDAISASPENHESSGNANPTELNQQNSLFKQEAKQLPAGEIPTEKKQENIKGNTAELKSSLPVNPSTGFSIHSIPEGAEVWINGQRRGETPFIIDTAEPGSYHIRLQKDGYRLYSKNLRLKAGESRNISASLEKLSGSLHVVTVPDSIRLYVDEKAVPVSESPIILEGISVGRHQVIASKKGYRTSEKEVVVQENENVRINMILEPIQGTLSIQVRPWGSVFIDNKLIQSSADTRYEMSLPVNEYKVSVVHPTLGKWEKKISIEENNNKKIMVDFNLMHEVTITAFDRNGQSIVTNIFLDGKDTGQETPSTISVRSGLHFISVQKDQYILAEKKGEILFEGTSRDTLKFVLEKIEL